MKVHPVFHVFLLEPYQKSSFHRRVQYLPPSIEVKNYEEYEVEKMLGSRRRWEKLEYLIHWHVYYINERMWEPTENLPNTPQKVEEFHQQNFHKPKLVQ